MKKKIIFRVSLSVFFLLAIIFSYLIDRMNLLSTSVYVIVIFLNLIFLHLELKEERNKKWLKDLRSEANKVGMELDYTPKLKVKRKKMSYEDAVLLGGPQTSPNSNVFKVGEKYSKPRKTYEDIILLWYRNGRGDYLKTIEWAISQGLSLGTPYEMFAMSNEYPDLCLSFELLQLRMVETTGCLFNQEKRVCCLTWDIFEEHEETIRSLELHSVSDFNEQDVFFVFKK